MDNSWQIKGKKKEKEKRSGETPGAGKIIFESPWAITKKVKKDVDIVETIMKNRAKAAETLGVGAEIIGQKKKRKSLKAPEGDTQTGKVQKKKQMPADDEQDSAPVAKKAKMSAAAAKCESSKDSKRSQIAGVPSASTHLETDLSENGAAKRPAYMFSGSPDPGVGAATGCGFHELQAGSKPLSHAVLRAVAALGFRATTPVQQATIPLLLNNKDVAVQACTGSGKTVAFLVPAFELLLRSENRWRPRDVGAIVIAPTRELAMQIMSVASLMAAHIPDVRIVMLTGGADTTESFAHFLQEGGNLVIGTPGRLQHTLLKSPEFNAKKLELLILDEADRLLDMGFQHSLNSILECLPKLRRTGLFSATMSSEVAALARAGLRNPRLVTVNVETQQKKLQATPLGLVNHFVVLPEAWKLSELVRFLEAPQQAKAKIMIFLLTCAHVDYFARLLPRLPQLSHLRIEALHGKMIQKKRTLTYNTFAALPEGVLLCTDVTARGIDIPDVDVIIQYDAPQDPSFFIHRVGRTARFGRSGASLLYLSEAEAAYVEFLAIRKVPLLEKAGVADAQHAEHLLTQVRQVMRADLDIHEKSQRAFVSVVRAYKEHQCTYIFQMGKLSLGGLASAMGLLRLPKMPELKALSGGYNDKNTAADSKKSAALLKLAGKGGKGKAHLELSIALPGFLPDEELGNVADLRYADKVREKARKKRIEKARVEGEELKKQAEAEAKKAIRAKNQAWSTQKDLKEKKGIRKEKKEIRSRAISLANSQMGSKMASTCGSRAASRGGSRAASPLPSRASSPPRHDERDEEMNKEAQLLKKLKRGLISREFYDKQTGWESD